MKDLVINYMAFSNIQRSYVIRMLSMKRVKLREVIQLVPAELHLSVNDWDMYMVISNFCKEALLKKNNTILQKMYPLYLINIFYLKFVLFL